MAMITAPDLIIFASIGRQLSDLRLRETLYIWWGVSGVEKYNHRSMKVHSLALINMSIISLLYNVSLFLNYSVFATVGEGRWITWPTMPRNDKEAFGSEIGVGVVFKMKNWKTSWWAKNALWLGCIIIVCFVIRLIDPGMRACQRDGAHVLPCGRRCERVQSGMKGSYKAYYFSYYFKFYLKTKFMSPKPP